MSRTAALAEESRRYWQACAHHDTRRAHIHRLALDRIRFPYRVA